MCVNTKHGEIGTGETEMPTQERRRNPQDNSEGQPQEDSHANCLVCWSGSGDWEKLFKNKNGKIPNEFEYIEKRLTCMRKSSQLD